MIQAILTRLDSTRSRLRTDEVVGWADGLPRVGSSFHLVGEPLEEGDARLVSTSPVSEVRHHTKEGSLEFWTQNSHYGLQILDVETEGGMN